MLVSTSLVTMCVLKSWSLVSLIQAGFMLAEEKSKALLLPLCWMLGSKLGFCLLYSALEHHALA